MVRVRKTMLGRSRHLRPSHLSLDCVSVRISVDMQRVSHPFDGTCSEDNTGIQPRGHPSVLSECSEVSAGADSPLA